MPSTTDRLRITGLALRRRARRDAEAAVAEDRGGDAEATDGESVGSQVICAS
jgi:hypothetical protein